jgi:hypothetical protein
MSRIESTQNQSQLGESVNGMNSVLAQLQDQIVTTNLTISNMAKDIAELKTADVSLKADL